MVNNYFNFIKRVAQEFDDIAKGSSEMSENNLSDLGNSFLARETIRDNNNSLNEDVFNLDEEEDKKEQELERRSKYVEKETKDELVKLVMIKEDDNVKLNIHATVEKACIELAGFSSSRGSFKRRLMSLLRQSGLDAGICKSKWGKTSECPLSGSYEYIDIVSNSKSYIIEVSLATHFEIARPTDSHISLLQFFPQIFVGEVQEIKNIVRLMCNSIKESMKKSGMMMSIPPWRRFAYMQAKWLGPYKRTIIISEVPKASKALDEDLAIMKSIGFVVVKSPISYCLREDFARAC